MMTGTITNLRPHVELFITGPGGQGRVEFTIDTGYSGTLTLPPAVCRSLQLAEADRVRSRLADGSQILLTSYYLTVEWDSEERLVEILAVGEEPLLGATMLEDYELCLNYAANTLTIKAAQAQS